MNTYPERNERANDGKAKSETESMQTHMASRRLLHHSILTIGFRRTGRLGPLTSQLGLVKHELLQLLGGTLHGLSNLSLRVGQGGLEGALVLRFHLLKIMFDFRFESFHVARHGSFPGYIGLLTLTKLSSNTLICSLIELISACCIDTCV